MVRRRSCASAKASCQSWSAIFCTRPDSGLRSQGRMRGSRFARTFLRNYTISLKDFAPRRANHKVELTLRWRGTYNRLSMNRGRIFASILLALTLPLVPLTVGAQQSSSDAKPQSPSPPQTTAPNQQPGQGNNQTFVREVTLVDVLFTVLNRRNKLVPDLDKIDFKVLDEGKPQEIRFFSKQTDLPLRIGILMDTSNSIRDRLKFEQDASVNFLFSVLRRNKDEAFVMTFDDEPQIIQPFTNDAGALRDQITRTRAGGGTAIYDAIYEACVKELSHPP